MGSDGFPSTRPVVTACRGMNVPLREVLSEILEPISRGLTVSDEVVSSENLLQMVDSLNRDWEGSGQSVDKPLLIAVDASSLYPSLDHSTSAEIVRQEVLLSDLNMQGVN